MANLSKGGIGLYHRFDKASPFLLICIVLQQSCVAYLLNCFVCFCSAANRYEFNRSVTVLTLT
jgi:hypothetical protein